LRYAQSEIKAKAAPKPPQSEGRLKRKTSKAGGAGCVWKNRLKRKTSKAGKFGCSTVSAVLAVWLFGKKARPARRPQGGGAVPRMLDDSWRNHGERPFFIERAGWS